jgi:RNA polymerase sigma-70 factor (ECF subfamily)
MKKGDEDAFDTFVRKYYDDILTYCGYHCSDLVFAEDLTQETFVRFFKNLSNYRHIGKTKNFLYTVARNLCKNANKKKVDIPLEEDRLKEHVDDKYDEKEDLLLELEVKDALEKLSDEFREVVILYYFQDLKLTEIADILDCGLPLIKYRMRQAKIQLKKYLEKEGKR